MGSKFSKPSNSTEHINMAVVLITNKKSYKLAVNMIDNLAKFYNECGTSHAKEEIAAVKKAFEQVRPTKTKAN